MAQGPSNSTVVVNNFPASQAIEDGGNSITVDGTVTIQDGGNTITVDNGGTFAVQATDSGSGKTLKTIAVSLSSTGNAIAAVATKKLKVYAVKLVCSAALSIYFRDGGSTALEGAQSIAANGGYVESINPPAFLFTTSAGNSLDLVISGTGTVAGRISYWDDDVS